jgi:hypothetical protein
VGSQRKKNDESRYIGSKVAENSGSLNPLFSTLKLSRYIGHVRVIGVIPFVQGWTVLGYSGPMYIHFRALSLDSYHLVLN